MVTMRLLPVFVATSLFALTGCELIGGIEKRTLEPSDAGLTDGPDQDVEIEAGEDAPISTKCELPPDANSSMRVGNLIPAYAKVDFCVKSTDETWADVNPLLAGGGGGCQRGLGYRELTTTFGIAAGVYDIIAVEDKGTATPPKCSDAAIAEATQVVITEGQTLGAVLFGDATSGAVLRPWKETLPSGSIETVVRFVNALSSSGNLDCGVAVTPELPATISLGAFTNVPFASFQPPTGQGSTAVGKIDANGYITLQVPGAEVSFAIASAGSADAILVKPQIYDRGGGFTVFAAGRLGDTRFPEEMLICDETKADGILARCGGLPVTLTVDSANVQLAGAWGPYDKDRAQPIQDAIPELPSDVVCVQEAWSKSVKDGIAAAAQAKFPNQAVFFADLDSAVDDATDQNGDTPPEYTEAPCAQSAAKFGPFMDCVRDNCVTPADESGTPAPFLSECVTKKCVAPALGLLGGSAEDKACYSCLFANLAGWESVATVRDTCSNNPKARFAHGGDTAVLVLSKKPILNPESWIIASTEWRVNIVRAPIKLDNDAVVDVYCTQLTTPGSGLTRPYTGQYGNGKGSDDAWREELYLQAHKLVNYVQARSASVKRKAVIVGTIYSGPAYVDSNLEAVDVDAYNIISAAFPPALPTDYVPSCTLCSDNTLRYPPGSTPGKNQSWQSFVFLSGIPVTAAKADSIFWKDPALTVVNPNNQEEYQVPLSTHYGFRSVIRVLK